MRFIGPMSKSNIKSNNHKSHNGIFHKCKFNLKPNNCMSQEEKCHKCKSNLKPNNCMSQEEKCHKWESNLKPNNCNYCLLYPSINQKELNFQISAIFGRRWLTTR